MAAQSARRFVVQEHIRGGDRHWDLMLEGDGVLWTWRLPVAPEQIGDAKLEVVKTFDHPMRFLTYEGSVNKGQGTVRIVDDGTCDIGVNKKGLCVRLEGGILKGAFELSPVEGGRWTIERVAER